MRDRATVQQVRITGEPRRHRVQDTLWKGEEKEVKRMESRLATMPALEKELERGRRVSDLRDAIRERAVYVDYHPIVEAETKKIFGYWRAA